MRVFVSYSRRDGVVTQAMLELLERHLSDVCVPFIHCLHGAGGRWEQLQVLRALFASHAILLVESPAASTSPWVRLEVWLGRLLCLPRLHLHAADLGIVRGEA